MSPLCSLFQTDSNKSFEWDKFFYECGAEERSHSIEEFFYECGAEGRSHSIGVASSEEPDASFILADKRLMRKVSPLLH